MRKLVAVVLFVAALMASALLVHGPARADWANTRWNMSRAEVQALYPDAAPVPEGDLLRSAPTEFAGVHGSSAKFVFDTDGLRVVVLPTNASFDELRTALTARYGASVSEWGTRGDLYMLFFKVAGTGEDIWIGEVAGRYTVSWGRPRRAESTP